MPLVCHRFSSTVVDMEAIYQTGSTSAGAIHVKADHVEHDERVQQRLHCVVQQLHARLRSRHP